MTDGQGMDYQIVATLGPSSDSEPMWLAMLEAGATAFRLNTSHLSLPQLQGWLDRLGPFRAGRTAPLILDLQGSKWRVGQFPAFELTEGRRVMLVCAESADRPDVLPVPHPDFFRAASLSSGRIVLNDAKLQLALESQGADGILARVLVGGEIRPRKGITYTASAYRHESLSQMDRKILARTRHLAGARYALSYVKDATEMKSYRAEIGPAVHLIAKLERQPAVDEAGKIAREADEIWLCRGDLGAELGMRGMAEAVYGFSEGIDRLRVPVLLAGQVLEHTVEHPAPTRAEVCELFGALRRGYGGFVLSDETAVGHDPVGSCRAGGLFRRRETIVKETTG